MGELMNFARAHATQAVSWAYHKFPSARGRIAERITQLTGQRDLHLRWRIGKVVAGTLVTGENVDSYWTLAYGHGEPNDPGSWRNTAIGTSSELWRPAVVYPIGKYMMIGTLNEQFVGRTDGCGTPSEGGAYTTTVVRAGPGESRFVLANAYKDGRHAMPVPTEVLSYPPGIPEGLHRV